MTTLETKTERFELMKWISERNAHIPMSDLAFLMGISAFEDQHDEAEPSISSAQEREAALC
ncbi:hypothetical protein [Mariprofundus ferrooxydans]|uniref:hypothetical protein n=1 Tax=Mariprofundus ferrooxydans TaxID=314344 RepID=UPI0014301C29|nr:hypothetical protein [Mariprofundus ferrooxydans]